ncbi:DUF2799 domain-containing protein [Vibrio sinaloensis]|uniref:DUF2799 domain-containing protein n=1 Tax=Photobacterium sp. (strain ATCC 43367) TaxID=379097 RepID=UPI0022AF56C9|nr:DUF2799 domain-containing protein [Vibrio sinaloensis]MCZ4295678.1 DUF2799 domain-containing protein [Vibrio sinaloensis]
MRYMFTLGLLLLAGCASQPTPLSSVESDWFNYGLSRGDKGYIQQSEKQLAKLDSGSFFNQALYDAYTKGYEQGRLNYCGQNAYMLGVRGRPYQGVCDQLDPFFSQDYMSGRNSTAGSIF